MSVLEGILARRHRNVNYYLNLRQTESEFVRIKPDYYDTNSLVGTEAYFLEVRLKFREFFEEIDKGSIGNLTFSRSLNRLGLNFGLAGNMRVLSSNSATAVPSFVQNYLGEWTIVRVNLTENGNNTTVQTYINNVLIITSTHNNMRVDTVQHAHINAIANTKFGTATNSNSHANLDIDYINLNGNVIDFKEGEGENHTKYDIVSDSNLNDINQNVWKRE